MGGKWILFAPPLQGATRPLECSARRGRFRVGVELGVAVHSGFVMLCLPLSLLNIDCKLLNIDMSTPRDHMSLLVLGRYPSRTSNQID